MLSVGSYYHSARCIPPTLHACVSVKPANTLGDVGCAAMWPSLFIFLWGFCARPLNTKKPVASWTLPRLCVCAFMQQHTHTHTTFHNWYPVVFLGCVRRTGVWNILHHMELFLRQEDFQCENLPPGYLKGTLRSVRETEDLVGTNTGLPLCATG